MTKYPNTQRMTSTSFMVGIVIGFILLAPVCLVGCKITSGEDAPQQKTSRTRFFNLKRKKKNAQLSGPVKQAHYIMGTLVEIILYNTGRASADAAFEAGFSQLRKVDSLMSTYNEESEISKINRYGAERSIQVSQETLAAIDRALHWARRTHGAFDLTIYPVVQLWRKAVEEQKVPSKALIEEALELVDHSHIRLNRRELTVGLAKKGVKLDLGGVAKGYGIDLAARAMRKAGVLCAVINTGGDLYGFGQTPQGQSPIAAIQHPFHKDKVIGTFPVRNQAVATSGNYERFLEIQGVKYGHILNTQTGMPVSEVISTTVIAPNAADADALATALFVLGPQEGRVLIERLPAIEALMLTLEPNHSQRFHVTITQGFQEIIKWKTKPWKAKRR